MRRITAVLAALLVTMTLPTPAHAAPMNWQPCGDEGLLCASLPVPVGELRLARLPALDERRGTVLYAPGGPGKDGIQQLRDATATLAPLRRHFDVVAFDTRYALAMRNLPDACSDTPPLLVEPRDRAEYERQAARQREAFERCAAADRTGLFAGSDSGSVAADMDAVRAALGERRINVTAESYGGITATAYARRFPHRVRAMHVDGTVDHTTKDVFSSRSAEHMLGRFAAWCADDPSCALHGQDVRRVWHDLVRRTDREPVQVSSPRFGTGRLTGMHLQFLGSAMVFADTQWGPFADAVARAARGDFAVLAEQALGTSYAWAQPRNLTSWCGDGLGFTSYEEYAALRRTLDRELPAFGRGGLWAGLMCSGWPLRPANPPGPLPVKKLPPLLGTGTWTDHEGTERLVRQVPGSATVRYDGPGHVLYVSGLSDCVAGHVVRYFEKREVPPPGTVCRPGG